MPDPALASEPPAAKETGLNSYELFFTWRDSARAHEYLRTYKSRRHRPCCEVWEILLFWGKLGMSPTSLSARLARG